MHTPRVIHDMSAVDAALNAEIEARNAERDALAAAAAAEQARAVGERRFKTGLAFLAGGLGIAAATAAANYTQEPKVVEVPKLVEVPKVVFIDKPLIVDKPVIVEKPVERIVEKPVFVPAPQAARPLPQQTLPAVAPAHVPPAGSSQPLRQFKSSPEFTSAAIKGRIVSHVAGVIRFDGGQERFDSFPSGETDTRVTTQRHDGDFGYCRELGTHFPNGRPQWECRVLHNGVVENVKPPFLPQVPQPREPRP